MNWEFRPQTILSRKERKEGMVGRGRPMKRREYERIISQVRGRKWEMNMF
jgi:hypothetical protein